jgi:hypothetical protein
MLKHFFFYQKVHGAAPFYFSLDKTLILYMNVALALALRCFRTTGTIATKLWWNGPWMAPSKTVSGDPDFQPRWPPS